MVGFDARMVDMSGIGIYIQNMMKHIKTYKVVLGESNKLRKYKLNAKILEYDAPIYGIKEQLQFPYLQVRSSSLNLFHVPHYNIPIFYKGKVITTIHDITHILFPEYLPNKMALLYARFMIDWAIKKSSHILTVSNHTKNDLIKYFKVEPHKITVIYNGVGDCFKEKSLIQYEYVFDKFSIPKNKKVILYVGNKKPHKNLERLLYAFKQLKCFKECTLILTGKGFENYTKFESIAKELEIDNSIVHTGIVSENELVDLYNAADLFTFPSLYEGFGLPPLEAMACGTPVICSNTSSLPEVVGEAAYLVDPYSIDSISNGIDRVLTDQVLKAELIRKGFERVKLFSWEECARKTYEVYERVSKEGNR